MRLSRSDLIIGVWLGLVAVAVPATAQSAAIEQRMTASILSVYTPPACVPGVPFADVTCSTGFDPWIEQFGLDGITAGCGGGNYCPGSPVTRDQMAVFVEKAMRGTSNWPPHTVLVFHHPAAEASSDVNSGTELLAMVAAIPSTGPEASSAANPWLVRVGPGIFDLGSGSLALPPYTALEGAGQEITVITATGYTDAVHGTMIMSDHARLSRLSIVNTGASTYGTAVYLLPSANAVGLGQLTVIASTPSNTTGPVVGVYAETNTSFSLLDADVTAHGSVYSNIGIFTPYSAGEARLNGVQVTVYGSNDVSGQSFGFDGAGSSIIANSRFSVSNGQTQDGIFQGGGTLDLRDSEVRVSGQGIGVVVNGASAALSGDLIVSQGWGVSGYGTGGATEIDHCQIEAGLSLVAVMGYTVTIGASKLVGPTDNISGTVNCFGNYTNSAFLPNTCP